MSVPNFYHNHKMCLLHGYGPLVSSPDAKPSALRHFPQVGKIMVKVNNTVAFASSEFFWAHDIKKGPPCGGPDSVLSKNLD